MAGTIYGLPSNGDIPPRIAGAIPGNPRYRQVPVAMFHDFPTMSAAQGILKDYKAWGYETVFFSELVDALRTGDTSHLPEKPLCITVDDGGLSNYTNLYPALQEFGMKATYFVVPAWINGDITAPANGGSFLEATPFTWANANEMVNSGRVELQSHTLTHGSMRMLTGAGTFTTDGSSDGTGAGADFLAARDMIEANVPGANVEHSAAPYGVINEAAIASLRDAGCLGQRITMTGRGWDGIYDGSGPASFAYVGVDPMRVPIADGGTFKSLRGANVYGKADMDGNRFQNGRFLVTARGVTLPSGWSTPSVPLPNGEGPATGPALRGYGTGAATGAHHTDLIPVGYFSYFMLDFFIQTTLSGATSARVVLDCYDTRGGALVKTLADPPGAETSNTSWKRKRWAVLGDDTYQYVRPRFEVVGATATSEMLIWDVKLRVQRNPLDL